MPIYEYSCPECQSQFELKRPIKEADEPALCPRCGSPGEKLVSNFASKVGFYLRVSPKSALRPPAETQPDGENSRV